MNADKAGAATNAEDFTKQFMSQMFGGPEHSSAAPLNEAPPAVPTAMKKRKYNMSTTSILMKCFVNLQRRKLFNLTNTFSRYVKHI